MSITWNDISLSGTSLRGYFKSPWSFEETTARLITASGQPAKSSDGYKTSVEFSGTFNGQVFTLYDYKGGDAFHIGGHHELDVTALQTALVDALRAVVPTPYTARRFYDETDGTIHGFSPEDTESV